MLPTANQIRLMPIKQLRRPASVAKHRSVEIASWPMSEIENDETVASVVTEGITGVEADAAGIELLMTVGGLDEVRVEVDLLPEEIVIRIKETVTATYLKAAVRAGKTFGEDVPPPVQRLQTRGGPLGHDPRAMPTNVLSEAVCGLQAHLAIGLGIGLRLVTGNENDHLAEIEIPEAAAIVADTIHHPPIVLPVRKVVVDHARRSKKTPILRLTKSLKVFNAQR